MVFMVLLAVTAFSLLVLATKTFSGEPPDLRNVECADSSDRAYIRAQRNACDDFTTNGGHNVGIFRPHNEVVDGPAPICPAGTTPFTCLGAPHIENFCEFPACG